MKNISDLIARKEYLPMPEDVQRELEEMFPKRNVEEDNLIQQFASGMISGAISASFIVLICASFIQLIPEQKSTDWKVHTFASSFFAITCAIVVKHFLDLNDLLRSNP